MQTCLWTQRIWIYNHLISISKYTHQISTSLILIFTFSDWNNGWSILNKKQTIVWFEFFHFKGLQLLLESKMQKVIFSTQNKGSQHLCAWLHSCGTDSSHFLFSLVFLLCFLYLTNPVRMKSVLFVWSQGYKNMIQHPAGAFSFLCSGQLSKTSPGWVGGKGIAR